MKANPILPIFSPLQTIGPRNCLVAVRNIQVPLAFPVLLLAQLLLWKRENRLVLIKAEDLAISRLDHSSITPLFFNSIQMIPLFYGTEFIESPSYMK